MKNSDNNINYQGPDQQYDLYLILNKLFNTILEIKFKNSYFPFFIWDPGGQKTAKIPFKCKINNYYYFRFFVVFYSCKNGGIQTIIYYH